MARLGRGDRQKFEATITSLSGLATYALSIFTGPLLARALDPAGRGDLAAVLVPTQLFGWIIGFGLPTAAAYYGRTHQRREIHTGAWLFTLIVGGLAVAIAWPFIPGYLSGHSAVTVTWFRWTLLANLLIVPVSVALEEMRSYGAGVRFNLLRALPFVANSAGVVALAIVGHLTLVAAMASNLISILLYAVVVICYCRSWPTRTFSFTTLKSHVRYGGRVAFGTLANLIIARLDQFLMVGLVSSDQLGIYVVAATAAGVSAAIGQGVALSLFPHLRQQKAAADRRANTTRSVRWVILVSGGIAVLMAAGAVWIIPLAFGHAFSGAVVPLWLMLPGQVLADIATVYNAQLMAEGRPGSSSASLAVGAVVSVLTIWPAVHLAGIRGAAVVTSISQAAVLATALYYIVKVRRDVIDNPEAADVAIDSSLPNLAREASGAAPVAATIEAMAAETVEPTR
jgi:O-antigen/teichoic acid export membrane protein